MSEIAKEIIKDAAITKSDIPALLGASTSGTICFMTENELAGISTVAIMLAVVIQKVFSMWLDWKKYKNSIKE